MKRLELVKHVLANGCLLLRAGVNQQSTIGRHRELDNLLCRLICRQLGIPPIGR